MIWSCAYLWNAVRTGIRVNPAIGALYRRLRAKGKRGDVAMGHCMCKLLHLVYAVWKTNRPFDENHFPWEGPSDARSSTAAPPAVNAGATAAANKKAVGHKRDLPAEKVVTTANSTVEPPPGSVKPASPRTVAGRPKVDFAWLREQITIQQVLEHLGFFASLRGSGQQRRGPCPIHSQPAALERTFSVHLPDRQGSNSLGRPDPELQSSSELSMVSPELPSELSMVSPELRRNSEH